MISKYVIRLSTYAAISLFLLGAAGCKEESTVSEKGVKSEEVAKQAESAKSLPTVTLTGTNIQEHPSASSVRINITASGAFGSNVVHKSDPERIMVIMHNARIGETSKSIEVNDGTIRRVEIAQLDTGKGPAVRITIGLNKKTAYKVIPAESALFVDIEKIK